PVYSGDFIRTAERSEAAIVLISGDTVTELVENTIIHIGAVKGTGESRIELLGGNVSLTAGSGGTVLAWGKDSLVLAAGSAVSAASGEGDFAFRVNEGNAVFTGSEGTVKTFRAGESVVPPGTKLLPATGAVAETSALPGGTGVEANAPPPPRLITPAEGEVFPYGDASGQAAEGEASSSEISFRWAADSDDDRIVALYIFEAADNPAMENAAVKMPVSGKRIVLPRPEKGRWYWRVTPVYAGALTAAASVTGSFIIGETVPAVERPAAEPVLAERVVTEQAAAVEQTASERVVVERVAAQQAVAEQAATERVVVERVAAQQAATERADTEQAATPPPLSSPREMRLENAYEDSQGNGYVLGTAQLRTNRSIIFNWAPVPDAAGSVFSLYQATGGARRRIYTVEVETANHTFAKLSLLERGDFVWTIEALWKTRDGTLRGDAAESRFVIDLPALERHELPETGNLYGN
ncbi:MAG: hypothetical protein LBP29_09315, partial [Treponema sp.]|nr:hypothetical protein [Treponema sp.]